MVKRHKITVQTGWGWGWKPKLLSAWPRDIWGQRPQRRALVIIQGLAYRVHERPNKPWLLKVRVPELDRARRRSSSSPSAIAQRQTLG